MRVLIDGDPYRDLRGEQSFWEAGGWPCRWLRCPEAGEPPFVAAYRLRFEMPYASVVRAHVAGDERYELYLDGKRVGRGSERGDERHWYFDSYDLPLSAGPHMLVARVWALGAHGPQAQLSVGPGFLFSPQEQPWIDLLGTGRASWEAMRLDGYAFQPIPITHEYFAVGDLQVVDGRAYPWGVERGEGAGWRPALVGHPGRDHAALIALGPGHPLAAATLPPMLEEPRRAGVVRMVCAPADPPAGPLRAAHDLPAEHARWNALLREDEPVVVAPHSARLVLVDLEQYYCIYPALTVSGGLGAVVQLGWAEALFDEPEGRAKGRRDAVYDKYFRGLDDTFLPEGGAERRFETLWWRCGRYLRLLVRTAGEALTIHSLLLAETRYPLELEARFEAGDPRLAAAIPLAFRALQMCAHETYMDCPYYEQLMYVGDTRLEALVTYVGTRDDRLPRKALRMFDRSRLPNGLTQSRYPSRVGQVIPPFSLWWIGMVYDYALWRDDQAFVRELMPGVRGVIDYFLARIGELGLPESGEGWYFMDWVPAWPHGVPPGMETGSGVLGWQLVLALGMAARLERWLGEQELADRADRHARALAERLDAALWDERRGLFCDDLEHHHASEHAQCLAILSGRLSADRLARLAQALLADQQLERTTIYFSHYLFEAYAALGQVEALRRRLESWLELPSLGFVTTPEQPEPSRSDCHAWGAHPLYHYLATILGVRPAGFGFTEVVVAPQLGTLERAEGALPHPRGEIAVALERDVHALRARVSLPEGVAGSFRYGGAELPLRPGLNELVVSGRTLEGE